MLDEDLRQLNARAADHSLEALEADIWVGLARRMRQRAITRLRVSLQSAVTGLSLFVSIAIGIHATRVERDTRPHAIVASGLELAPSSLLLGKDR